MCERIRMPDGNVGVVCGGHRKKKPCKFCGAPAMKQCDWPLSNGKTCDVYVCDRHSLGNGLDKDFCAVHAQGAAEVLLT